MILISIDYYPGLVKEKAILTKKADRNEKLSKIIGEKQKKIATQVKEIQTKNDLIKALGATGDEATPNTDNEQSVQELGQAESHGQGDLSHSSEEDQTADIMDNGLNRNYLCHVCSEMFNDESDLINHIKSNHAVEYEAGEVTGNACSVAQGNGSKEEGGNNERGTFACPECGKKCRKQQGLIDHMKRVHVEGSYVKCENCEERFKENDKLRDHIVAHHVFAEGEEDEGEPEVISVDENQKCKQCNATFDSKTELNNHIRIHVVDRWECPICWKLFQPEESLVKHMSEDHSKDSETGQWETVRRAQNPRQQTCQFCQSVLKTDYAKQVHICPNHPYQSMKEQELRVKRRSIPCKRGNQCEFLKTQKCWFFHRQPTVRQPQGHRNPGTAGPAQQQQSQPQQQQQESQQQQHGPQQQQRKQLWCKYQESCDRGNSCRFRHFNQGFQQTQAQRRN